MVEPQNIKSLIAGKSTAEAIGALSAMLAEDPENHDVLVERGKLFWKLGNRGAAMSDYEHAARINPYGPGALLLEHSNTIMDFFNPDLLNP